MSNPIVYPEEKLRSIINPCTDEVPAYKMANFILNAESKEKLVIELIEDKRLLTKEIEKLEEKIKQLEKYDQAAHAYIYHLIQKLGKQGR